MLVTSFDENIIKSIVFFKEKTVWPSVWYLSIPFRPEVLRKAGEYFTYFKILKIEKDDPLFVLEKERNCLPFG